MPATILLRPITPTKSSSQVVHTFLYLLIIDSQINVISHVPLLTPDSQSLRMFQGSATHSPCQPLSLQEMRGIHQKAPKDILYISLSKENMPLHTLAHPIGAFLCHLLQLWVDHHWLHNSPAGHCQKLSHHQFIHGNLSLCLICLAVGCPKNFIFQFSSKKTMLFLKNRAITYSTSVTQNCCKRIPKSSMLIPLCS